MAKPPDPFDTKLFPTMYVSGVGVVPKKSGKLRLIHHLSSPLGRSVNDGIPKDDFSLHYVTIDDAISAILAAGRGCYLSKVDIKSAFRICPVRPADWPLLASTGKENITLNVPYRSAFALARQSSTQTLTPLSGSSSTSPHHCSPSLPGRLLERCRAQFTGRHKTALHHSRRLPLSGYSHCHGQAPGPSQVLPFLGVELDTVLFEARLPADKLPRRFRLPSLHILHVRCQFCVIGAVRRNLQFFPV